MREERSILVVGAGAGGLSAAIALALRGFAVTVLEKAASPGGKMRRVVSAGASIDAGPTVLTMKWAFDGLLAPAGLELGDLVSLRQARILARHFWDDGSQLDLMADRAESARAIARFAGSREADGYLRFCRASAAVHDTLRDSYIASQRPGPVTLSRRIGLTRPGKLFALQPFRSLWSRLGTFFEDPRLRQLFARYATYCGSSPFRAPATLMLVAHVEQDGVWIAQGGMHGVASALAGFAAKQGVDIRYGCEVVGMRLRGGRVTSLRLASGEELAADAVVFNGDVSALSGLIDNPAAARREIVPAHSRSLSAITWCAAIPGTRAPLVHHNVWFAADYRAEFETLAAGRVPVADPTVYACAQDRDDSGDFDASGAGTGVRERLLFLVNAPADGDTNDYDRGEVERCLETVNRRLGRSGLSLDPRKTETVVTTPADFHRLFPGTGGAIYGRAQHGWMASFQRPGARLKWQGLYLAGGSVHPGPGVPMAVLSGRLAADCVMEDLGSMPR